IIGRGGFGPVYHGALGAVRVAVKVLEDSGGQGRAEFEREVRILSACRHAHVLPLLGFSAEAGRPLCLVYPFMAGGSLQEALRPGRAPLSAAQRLRIAADVARGLCYLHAAYGAKPCIVHRDVKSANVLLDAALRARVADAGLARDVDEQSTMTRGCALGSPGYLDPEYAETFELTAGSDVFSFGVVLLELLT
ncbi:kinase-like domain-containing protein, partial [Pelagophyceae sp. CCMP2097]